MNGIPKLFCVFIGVLNMMATKYTPHTIWIICKDNFKAIKIFFKIKRFAIHEVPKCAGSSDM